MQKVIFYSWQSDLPNSQNRGFIETALSRALRAIGRDHNSEIDPVMDRDTENRTGSPDISSSIFAKIATADVFIADVSIVSGASLRPSPNPNVLIELGYAVAELGWDKIILVMNTEFGGPECLPFDLRGHRTVTYQCAETSERAPERSALQGRLEGVLRAGLELETSGILPTGPNAKLWWGQWEYDGGPGTSSYLFIREVGASGFLFDLETCRGSHTGQLTAWARFITNDHAYCRVSNEEIAPDGELTFRREVGGGRVIIDLSEITNCTFYHGARANFSGSFVRKIDPFFNHGVLNEIELQRLYTLLGNHISDFTACVGDIMGETDNQNPPKTRTIQGGHAGLYTISEYILIVGSSGTMWAAYLKDDIVTYFTNVAIDNNKMPDAIVEWAARFEKCRFILCPAVSVVPPNAV